MIRETANDILKLLKNGKGLEKIKYLKIQVEMFKK